MLLTSYTTMQKPVLRFLFLLLALSWAGVLYYLSAQPGTDTPPLFMHQDKLLHFFAFGLLGFLTMGAIRTKGRTHHNWQVWLIVLLVGLYGVVDEFHQRFVPGRDASIYDIAADMAGGILGAWALYDLVKTLARLRCAPPLADQL
jgi:VanZ family protein